MTELNLKKLRVPDDIYVNLGLGDDLEDPANSENFKKTYVDFVQKLAKVWPKAKIYLLLPLVDTENGLRFDTVEAAAMETAATVKNVKFINTRGLEIERAKDEINPSPAGYQTYSDFVLDKLKIKR